MQSYRSEAKIPTEASGLSSSLAVKSFILLRLAEQQNRRTILNPPHAFAKASTGQMKDKVSIRVVNMFYCFGNAYGKNFHSFLKSNIIHLVHYRETRTMTTSSR